MGLKPGKPDPSQELLESFAHIVSVSLRRQQAEAGLRESEERYRALFRDNPSMLFTVDADGKVISVNQFGASQLGYTVDELEGHSVLKVFFREEQPAVTEQLKKCLQSPGQVFYWQFRKVRKDNSILWVEEYVRAVSGPEGILNVLVVCQDITDRKQAEEALRQANKKLTLVSRITRHDITNQLTVLQGYLTILEEKLSNPTHHEYFQKAETAAQRIATMIRFTREYEKIGVNAPVWQDCRTLVDTAAEQAPLGKVKTKNDIPAGTEIFTDPLIARVFYNLMDNAARYGGKITTVRFSVEEHDGNQHIVCEDNGEGVPAGEKERIFERGFGKNTGLGLALSREILDITGITIRETGEPGQGARFEIVVPKGAFRLEAGSP